ncbi:MAG: acyl-ACP--UDP-N-acetylglucosamine O-acyltransferase [Proteobacteria bacterium]|nr:acyl-ACP--UDP-N-acetylglucosamine O-acyltransferase [Pseudomonadota bacterium]
MNIHPTAIVSPEAHLEEGVEVGPYTVINPDVTIGKNTVIGPHVVIESHTDIGENCRIFQFCSLGGDPQDLKFGGEESRVIIGNNNTIREYVTINRATSADIGVTIIGDNNFLMAYCHIAHNCKLENNIVMANASTLAGHIHVEDYAIIGGMVGFHQFTRIGCHCMIGGASAVSKDVPPYVLAAGNYAEVQGLNLIGLKRRGFKKETIRALKKAYTIIFRSSLLLSEAIKRVEEEVEDIPEVKHFIDFIQKSERGICR